MLITRRDQRRGDWLLRRSRKSSRINSVSNDVDYSTINMLLMSEYGVSRVLHVGEWRTGPATTCAVRGTIRSRSADATEPRGSASRLKTKPSEAKLASDARLGAALAVATSTNWTSVWRRAHPDDSGSPATVTTPECRCRNQRIGRGHVANPGAYDVHGARRLRIFRLAPASGAALPRRFLRALQKGAQTLAARPRGTGCPIGKRSVVGGI